MDNAETAGGKRPIWVRPVAALLVVFGLLTIFSGGEVVLGDPAARVAAGDYVAFVVWFNFLAGFSYAAAGIGLWFIHRWSVWLALGIALATAIVFAAFIAHVALGGAFEARTVGAMILRTAVWSAVAVMGARLVGLRGPPRSEI